MRIFNMTNTNNNVNDNIKDFNVDDRNQETNYLLSSDKNARHLMESIKQLEEGKLRTVSVINKEEHNE